MSVNTEKFSKVINSTAESFKKYGFEQVSKDGVYTTVDGDSISAYFTGEKGVVRLKYENEKFMAFQGNDAENLDNTPSRILLALLPEDADDKDISYVSNEICDTLETKFGAKSVAPKKVQGAKGPQTVSKAAVKAGSFYDPNTLASKLCLVFPEIRDAYKQNIADYGDFLSEEFFINYGAPAVINAIKANNPATMKKMFQVLNEIYEDGTNDTQSLIAVTILGQLENDQILLARCVDYMSETMAPPVIEVNKFLATSAGKKAKKKLQNPPAYKPKKQKKGFLDKAMSGTLGQQ